ncbi:DUF883 family protein [Roseovarius aestuariivivens]|uniref:DUF883 family protein n=1 Tax=Roseovarius aestuariivivens TaxID=1888910 RepID=UPI001436B135|nr:DUF883 family protein [Roseovarius aestuariivivens]
MTDGSRNVGRDDVEKQFQVIREDITTLSKLLREIGEAKAGEAREAALAEANELLERSRSALDDGRLKAKAATETIEDHIRTKPLQSAMIALGVGFLVGVLTRR